jgi:septum site-determining protein MinC
VQSRQYSVKVFELTIEDENQVINFFNANHSIFKDHLIVVNGAMSKNIEKYLKEMNLSFLHNVELPKGRNRKALEEEIKLTTIEDKVRQLMMEQELEKLSDKLQNNLEVCDKLLRSGQEMKTDKDLLLLNRVNSGATIITSGNLIITGQVSGIVKCSGSFMMLGATSRANVLFHGVGIDNKLLEAKLNRIEFVGNEIIVTPLLRKDISWE